MFVVARGFDEVENIVDDGRVELDRGDGVLNGHDVGAGHHRLQAVQGAAAGLGGEYFVLGGTLRVADGNAKDKAIELILGEIVGSLKLKGVLRGDDHEGAFQGD